MVKARQIGWSTLVAVYALWLTFFWQDFIVLMLSKGEREAEKLLAKATYTYDRLPKWMQERGPSRPTRNLKKLSFDNGSSIESVPSRDDPGRSSTASLVIVDECAFLENQEEAWAAIEPIADVGGRIIILSTVKASGDWFHQHWVKATTGITDFMPMFFPWWANTERDDAWYETKRRTMLEWQLHREYPSSAEEAFIKAGNPVFDTDALDQMPLIEPERGNLVWEGFDCSLQAPRFEKGRDGPVSIFRWPERDDVYVVGADVSEGLAHGDYSSVHVLSVKHNQVVATFHGHTDPDLLAHPTLALGWLYNCALVGIEVNNHGLTTCKAAQRLEYPRLYYRKALDQRTRVQRQQVGWYTSHASKPLMIDELTSALREGLSVPCAYTLAELKTYVRDDRGRTNGSPFDDRVMSLAVAVQMLPHAFLSPYNLRRDTYFTFEYFLDKAMEETRERTPLGAANVA